MRYTSGRAELSISLIKMWSKVCWGNEEKISSAMLSELNWMALQFQHLRFNDRNNVELP